MSLSKHQQPSTKCKFWIKWNKLHKWNKWQNCNEFSAFRSNALFSVAEQMSVEFLLCRLEGVMFSFVYQVKNISLKLLIPFLFRKVVINVSTKNNIEKSSPEKFKKSLYSFLANCFGQFPTKILEILNFSVNALFAT